jgi:hypothetical protein
VGVGVGLGVGVGFGVGVGVGDVMEPPASSHVCAGAGCVPGWTRKVTFHVPVATANERE